MNKLLAYPYIKETVNQNRLTSPMSTGANATVPKVRRHYFIRGVYFLVYGLKGPLGLFPPQVALALPVLLVPRVRRLIFPRARQPRASSGLLSLNQDLFAAIGTQAIDHLQRRAAVLHQLGHSEGCSQSGKKVGRSQNLSYLPFASGWESQACA